MVNYILLAGVNLLLVIHLSFSIVHYQPEQIHLSYGDNVSEIVVTWSTPNNTFISVVEYGIGGLILQANGTPTRYESVAPNEIRQQYIHRVKLVNLTPGVRYLYHCGSELGWSEIFLFLTPPEDQINWSPQLAIYGDLGNENAQSLTRLQQETERGMYDAVLHVGDFAYDMDWKTGRVGDEFMRQIQSIAAYVPYMTCPGNHEQARNYSEYRARFTMPDHGRGIDESSFFYSFNMGPVHFISISTEVYYFVEYGIKLVSKQYDWFVKDLQEASSPENRTIRPWIILFGHRPMYCSNEDHDDCTTHQTRTRIGIPFLHWFGLEKLLYDHGVDLAIWAHEHSYERLWPIYDYQILNGSMEEPYHNPGATVHITSGSAGCRENTDKFQISLPEWSAFRSIDYGYMRMKVYNHTHLYVEQVSDDKEGEVIDHIWLIKDNHGKFSHKQQSTGKTF